MLKFFLALRYLRKRKVTLFALLSVSVGALAFITVMGVMDGYAREFEQRLRNLVGDVVVSAPGYQCVPQASHFVNLVSEVPGVRAAAADLRSVGVLKVPRKRPHDGPDFAIEWCMFIGVDPQTQLAAARPELQPPLVAADFAPGGKLPADWIVLGRGLMQAYDLAPGDSVWLITSRDTPVQRLRPRVQLWVVASVDFGLHDFDREIAYVPRSVAARLMDVPVDSASEIHLALTPDADYQETLGHVETTLWQASPGLFRVRTLRESSNMFRAIESQRNLSRLILFFLFLISGFAVVAVLFLIVLSRRHDIGTLRAVGFSRPGIAWTFLTYAGSVALVGASAGILIGWLILSHLDDLRLWTARTTNYDPFPAELYGLDHIPWTIEPLSPVLVMVTAVVVSLVAGTLPALWAARLDPIESLRNE